MRTWLIWWDTLVLSQQAHSSVQSGGQGRAHRSPILKQ